MDKAAQNLMTICPPEIKAVFAGRESGKRFWASLEEALRNIPEHHTFYLSFSDADILDVTFADEVFVNLALLFERGLFSNKFVLIQNASETVIENINAAMHLRVLNSKPKPRNLVIPVKTNQGIQPVGKIEDYLFELWQALHGYTELTASDLSTDLKISLRKASTYLHTLYKLRLLKRQEHITEKGRFYAYQQLYIQPEPSK